MANEEGTAQLENLRCVAMRIVVSRSTFPAHRACLSCLEQHVIEGDNPVRGNARVPAMCFQRVGLFGNAAQNGW